jgi:hypothetical protein
MKQIQKADIYFPVSIMPGAIMCWTWDSPVSKMCDATGRFLFMGK